MRGGVYIGGTLWGGTPCSSEIIIVPCASRGGAILGVRLLFVFFFSANLIYIRNNKNKPGTTAVFDIGIYFSF